MSLKVVRDPSWQRFVDAAAEPWWRGRRIKDVRHEPLWPGGRARLVLFEKAEDEGRAHPRLRLEMPPATDPHLPSTLYAPPPVVPASAAGFAEHLARAVAAVRPRLDGSDVAPSSAPRGSERFFKASIRTQRTARFFAEVRAQLDRWLAASTIPPGERAQALYALRVAEDLAFAGELVFDDDDTGTYHGYRHDQPFVHWLEQLLGALPAVDQPAFAALPPEQQESVHRQRRQAQRHLDWLWTHKYARDGIRETDIERSLGGLLVERESRRVVSETRASRNTLVPAYELLRIDPAAAHAHAGAWIYRDGDGTYRLESGAPVEIPDESIRAIPVAREALVFTRAANPSLLRHGIRFDWDGDGYVRDGEIGWVAWAGHCDIKAVMEQLGVTFNPSQIANASPAANASQPPRLVEHRSDTGLTHTWDRKLLVEMMAAALELGSQYRRADGSGWITRGVHRFGGARNDSLPDRLELQGAAGGSFRWPPSNGAAARGEDAFRVIAVDFGQGAEPETDRLFLRFVPDSHVLDFAPNPRWRGTVDGDRSVIDVSGARLECRVRVDTFDEQTGYPRRTHVTTIIDLGPAVEPIRPIPPLGSDPAAIPPAPAPVEDRALLGTEILDPAARRLTRYLYDRRGQRVIAVDEVWVREGDRFRPRPIPGERVVRQLARPPRAQLGRESRQDDPALLQALLGAALHHGQNINADTDAAAPVWNGTVTRLAVRRLDADPLRRVERWQVDLTARFGEASMQYLLRRDLEGTPIEYCPILSSLGVSTLGEALGPPDFLWQDFPDVGSKGIEDGEWVVSESMLARGIVDMEHRPSEEGGFYVHDDHIKSTFEMLFAALGGYPFTIVHCNKRYGFADEQAWKEAIDRLAALRAALRFVDG